MNMYEINQKITDLVDPETGEILDFAAFESVQLERTEKLEAMALWCKELDYHAAAIKEEEAALSGRRRALENKAESLKRYLDGILAGEAFTTARCAVSYRKSVALEIADADETAAWLEKNGLPDFVTHPAPTIDKRSVTAYLKQGNEVPGAALVERQNLQLK